MEPLQDAAYQKSVVIVETEATIHRMLEEVNAKVTDQVSAQIVSEVTEVAAKAEGIIEEVRQRVTQLVALA